MKRIVLSMTGALIASATSAQAQVPEQYRDTFVIEDCANGNPRLEIEAKKVTYAFMSNSDRGPLLNYGACGFQKIDPTEQGIEVMLYCRKAIGPGSTEPFTLTQSWRVTATTLVVTQGRENWTYRRCPKK